MTLVKETRWERYDQPRFLQGDVEDMIEVDLKDDMAFDRACDKCTTDTGEVLVSAQE